MEEDTDMAYGRVQGTYQGTVTFEEKRDFEKEEERLSKYDFYHWYSSIIFWNSSGSSCKSSTTNIVS